ncbi:SDR family oxidoreductase [Variovorax sp. J22P168]|uniref:SDR family oxidoreductase n=1 Tax=Variovorax jilinensis TaxID=3053513 RepID=UPI00257567F5|nr:SDR family oxidoreductase [Variovorax sp. J22P168]MDM0015309.1 SDR family oxidoreductase [Variovorax sp. J22P168]
MNDGTEGKVVLITGGGTGLGAETARLLASKGAKVAVAARRKEKLDRVVAEIGAAGGQARACPLDVTDKSQMQAVVNAVIAEFGRLDVLVNNAGLMPIRPMSEVNTDEWDAMIDVNLKGTLYGIAAALPAFLAQESGHIITMSSVAGLKVSAPGGVVYSGTKFAVRAVSEGLRLEVGPKIRVTTIAPGYVESDLKYGTTSGARSIVMDIYKAAIPASSVARAIAYAIEQPADVDINEIVLRPTSQEY